MTNKEKALALIGTFVSGDTAMKTESFNVTLATTSATKSNGDRRAQIVQWTIVLRRPKWNGEIKNADIKQIYGCTSYFYMCGYI